MASIVGEKWYNVEDAASLDASIADLTAKLTDAQAKYNAALAGIAKCNNKALHCVDKSGRHISTWRDMRDQYKPLIARYKLDLQATLDLKASLATTSQKAAETSKAEADAKKAIADADLVTTESNVKKYLIIGGIGLGVILAGLLVFKVIKSKKP